MLGRKYETGQAITLHNVIDGIVSGVWASPYGLMIAIDWADNSSGYAWPDDIQVLY